MPPLSIATYTTTYDPENIVDGELGEDASTDTDLTVVESVEEAIEFLRDAGITSPSCWPMPDNVECVWYSSADQYSDPYTGITEDVSGHLAGFDRVECATIYRALKS